MLTERNIREAAHIRKLNTTYALFALRNLAIQREVPNVEAHTQSGESVGTMPNVKTYERLTPTSGTQVDQSRSEESLATRLNVERPLTQGGSQNYMEPWLWKIDGPSSKK